ncbi:MAG TPA: hypothetical protein VFB63_19400 [Bryobacteraceae bacterium]|nr:hypothetical protein [Bryobacteraceae bacterium]
MRDIELTSETDLAYTSAAPGGLPVDTTAVDPSFTDTKAYLKPSLGGEFGPALSLLLGAPADGGEALLDAAAVVTVTPPVVPTAPIVWPGRAANNTSVLNLYPWRKTPPQGLDQNNPNPPPAMEEPEPSGITVTGNVLVGNQGSATFSGPAQRNTVIRLTYSINDNPLQTLDIHVLSGDTGSQIAAKARAAVDAVFGLDAGGTGGTVNVVGLGGLLTHFNISVI